VRVSNPLGLFSGLEDLKQKILPPRLSTLNVQEAFVAWFKVSLITGLVLSVMRVLRSPVYESRGPLARKGLAAPVSVWSVSWELDVGYRVLLDKDGHTSGWQAPTYRAHIPAPPSQTEYEAVVEEFWWSLTYTAKALWRRELVHAHFLISGCLFAWMFVGVDPVPRLGSTRLRTSLLIVALGSHAVLAKLIYAGYGSVASSGTAQLREGAEIMYYGGDVIDLILLTTFFAQWSMKEGRRLRHHQPKDPAFNSSDVPRAETNLSLRGAGSRSA